MKTTKKKLKNSSLPTLELPPLNHDFINSQDCFLLFESSLIDENSYKSYIFFDPLLILECKKISSLNNIFSQIEKLSRDYYLAGYISYEAGFFFQEAGKCNYDLHYPFHLVRMGVFSKSAVFNHLTGKIENSPQELWGKHPGRRRRTLIKNLSLTENLPQYLRKIRSIKNYLKEGQTYQVNYTLRYFFKHKGCVFSLYQRLKKAQPTPYTGFLKFKDEYILTFSPELFFKIENNNILCKPMKGTIKRGKDILEDAKKKSSLLRSEKNKAENLMIVDMVRNDLGRICRNGSVEVSKLFEIEKYKTLFQMTSTVKGILREKISYLDILRSIFPCASITGAPKIRTMEIIKEMEDCPRKVYCGGIGIIFPSPRYKSAVFNVPIRTISIKNGAGELGVGGGILINSQPCREYEECRLKANFLIKKQKDFRLLESILWKKHYLFLEEHLKRMQNSAKYFDFYFDIAKIKKGLFDFEKKLSCRHPYKVRLLLSRKGEIELEGERLKNTIVGNNRKIMLSTIKTDPKDIFLYHKTTHRYTYNSQYKEAVNKGFAEVIFTNNRGEITEGSISNIFVMKDNMYFTPPLKCGLLDGIYRRKILKGESLKAAEKILFYEDLVKADKIFICNSVRGMAAVQLGS